MSTTIKTTHRYLVALSLRKSVPALIVCEKEVKEGGAVQAAATPAHATE